MNRQTNTQRDRQTHTHIWNNRLIESIGPEGQCIEEEEKRRRKNHSYIPKPSLVLPQRLWVFYLFMVRFDVLSIGTPEALLHTMTKYCLLSLFHHYSAINNVESN